jgi:hypothetical protein
MYRHEGEMLFDEYGIGDFLNLQEWRCVDAEKTPEAAFETASLRI